MQRTVWSDFVVIPPPVFDDISGMFQIHKPVGIQTLVTQSADKLPTTLRSGF
jgi:hypothetical protein